MTVLKQYKPTKPAFTIIENTMRLVSVLGNNQIIVDVNRSVLRFLILSRPPGVGVGAEQPPAMCAIQGARRPQAPGRN